MGEALTERQLAAALEQLAEAVTVQRADGRLVFANAAAVHLLGCADEDEVLSADPGVLFARFRVLHPDGRPVAADELPGRVALTGREPDPLVVRWLDGPGSRLRWTVIKATPLVDDAGGIVGAVNIMEDVTDAQEAQLAFRLLAEASRALASSLDYERTLEQVARLAVPALADWCAVDVLTDRGELERTTAGDGADLTAALGERPATVARTGAAVLEQDLAGDAHSLLVVPLEAARGTIGALSLALSAEGRRYTPGDVAVAQELGRRAASAIRRARRYTSRREITDVLQASLLPRRLPEPAGWRVAVHFEAAGDVNDVGGDFYDLVPVPGGHLAMVGDVLGKGASAAALTPRVRHTLAAAARLTGDPRDGLALLDDALGVDPERLCCSVVLVLLGERDEVEAISAGHPSPFVVRAGAVEELDVPGGKLLGVGEDPAWPGMTTPLRPGEALVLYTDGVTEAVGAGGERFGTERLAAALGVAEPGADGAVAALRDALAAYAEGPLADDVAIVAIERLG